MSTVRCRTTLAVALSGAVAFLATAPSAHAQDPQPRQVVARVDRPDNDLFDLPHPDAPAPRVIESAPAEPAARFRSVNDSLLYERYRDVAEHSGGFRIVVSLEDHHLWVLAGPDTVLSAAAAVARGTTLDFDGRSWTFVMPRGVRTVLEKREDPTWQPPDWLYFETASEYGLKLEILDRQHAFQLSDGRLLSIQGDQVGVVDHGTWAALPVGEHIVFDSTLFMPPLGTKNRVVAGELGKYALSLGDGFMIHGTPEKSSIGLAATHGCVRLADKDIAWLYDHVGVGVKVYVY